VVFVFITGEFAGIRGYGNMARRMGLRYERLDLSNEQSSSGGATVPSDRLTHLVREMSLEMVAKPSCVLSSVVKDPFFDSIPLSPLMTFD
jgi:hypothetical protein